MIWPEVEISRTRLLELLTKEQDERMRLTNLWSANLSENGDETSTSLYYDRLLAASEGKIDLLKQLIKQIKEANK